jgi:hypothetical protein
MQKLEQNLHLHFLSMHCDIAAIQIPPHDGDSCLKQDGGSYSRQDGGSYPRQDGGSYTRQDGGYFSRPPTFDPAVLPNVPRYSMIGQLAVICQAIVISLV